MRVLPAFFKLLAPPPSKQGRTIIRRTVKPNGCGCTFGSWRDARVCPMHLANGYGKYFYG